MRKFVIGLLLTLGVVANSNAQPLSDYLGTQLYGRPVWNAVTAIDKDAWLIVKYVGSASTATVAVTAAGQIDLTSGGVADTTVNCGGTPGSVVVSNASCDTVGEAIAAINASPNWIAVNYASLLADDLNSGGSGSLLLLGATTATLPQGVPLYAETAIVKKHTMVLSTADAINISFYVAGGTPKYNGTLKPNPFQGFRTFLAADNGTYAFTGAGNWELHQIKQNFASKTAPTEVDAIIYGNVPSAATTVNKVFASVADTYRFFTDNDMKCLIRVGTFTTLTGQTHYALGYIYPSK